MTGLRQRRCKALDAGAPMNEAEIRDHLAQVNGWRLADGSIEKTFTFENYHETIAFVNAVAWVCNTEDHHPDLHVSYGRCVLRFTTHSVGGISINDFICAAKADALVALVG
jgi:4a-hydroxytetrahydrobiopterin dehydratase